jgi:hypothetical protein
VREAVLEHPDYYRLREKLISFLEHQDATPEARAERGLAAVVDALPPASSAQP